jgi:hypothetical protein
MSLEQDYVTVPGQFFALISLVGPDCAQKGDQFGLKIRGVFSSREEASSHAKRLQRDDATFDIYLVDMYKWLLIPPDRTQIEDVHYQNEKLEEIMTKYKENQRLAAAMFEQRKRDMSATPIPGSDTPFITPGDENSKFYNRPDIAPIPHPSEILEDLKKEFPDKPIDELVQLADERVADEIEKRKIQQERERQAAADAAEAAKKVE